MATKKKTPKLNKAKRANAISWMTNVGKSLGYVTADRFTNKMPAISGTFDNSREIIDAAKEYGARIRQAAGLKGKTTAIFGRDTSDYMSKAITLKDNLFEDIKTGKFHNVERQNEVNASIAGFGGDDGFDVDFDFDSALDDDGFDFNDEDDEDSPTVVSPNVSITSNITADNPMVKAVEKQTELNATIAESQASREIELSKASLSLISTATTALSGNLGTVNENLANLIDFNNNVMSEFASASTAYYSNSLTTMTSILDEVRKLTSPQENKANNKNVTSVTDIFGVDGSVYVSDYIELIKKNISNATSSSTVGSMVNMAFGTGFIDSIIASPLTIVLESVIDKMVPKAVDQIIEQADQLVGAFIPALVGKLGQYADDFMANPILQFLGSALGIKSTKTKVDLSKYEKGPIPFDGMTKKSIVEIIPTYLSKILAAISGKEEMVWNAETGKYQTISAMRADYTKNVRRRSLSPYDAFDEVEGAIRSREDLTDEERAQLLKKAEDAFIKMGRISGAINFRDADELNKIFNADSIKALGVSDNTISEEDKKFFIDVFKSLKTQDVLKMFSGINKMESGEAEGRYIRRMQEDNPLMLTTLFSGAYDELKSADQIAKDKLSVRKGETEKLNQIKELLKSGKDIPEELKDVELDYEARVLKKERDKQKGNKKFTLFKDTENPLLKFIAPIIEKPLNIIGKGVDKVGDKMLNIIFGKEVVDNEGIEGEGGDGQKKKSLIDRLKDRLDKTKDWFHEKLFGDEGFFTKIQNSDFYKSITGKMKSFGDYLFDEQNGLFKGVANTFRGYKDNTVNYFKGENGVFDKMKERGSSFTSSVREAFNDVMYGDRTDITIDDKGYAIDATGERVSAAKTVKTEIFDGFKRFGTLLFGEKSNKTTGDDGINWDEFTAYAKDNAPDAVANGIIGLGAGAVLSATSTGLLSSFVLGPIGGAAVGFAGTFLARSQTFQNLMFGYDDERTGKRIEGFISDKTQQWFKDNKSTLIAGAGIGSIAGIMGAGALPAMVLGGPISGAILGLATAFTLKSDAFQTLMFGDLGEDGTRSGGAIDKFKEKVLNRPEIKNKELFGNVGAGTLGGLGLFTIVGLNPILGASIGIASGLAISSEKWRTKLFGKEGKDGAPEDGILTKVVTSASENMIKPLLITGAEAKTYLVNWFDEKIAVPIVTAADYAFEGIKAAGGMLKDWFTESKFGEFMIDNLIDPIKNIFFGVAGAFKSVASLAGKLILRTLATPVKLGTEIVKGIGKALVQGRALQHFTKWIGDGFKESATGKVLIGIHDVVSDGFNWLKKTLFGLVKTVVTAPFKLLGFTAKGIGAGAKWIGNKVSNSSIVQSFIENVVEPTRESRRNSDNPGVRALQGLKDRESSRLQKLRERQEARKKELNEFKERLKGTSITESFGNARDAAKAMKGKYGRDYAKLSPLERAKIDRDEQQAQDIHTQSKDISEIKDLLTNIKIESESNNNTDNTNNGESGGPQMEGISPKEPSSLLGAGTNNNTNNNSLPTVANNSNTTDLALGADGKVNTDKISPDIDPTTARTSEGVKSAFTSIMGSADSPLGKFLGIGTKIFSVLGGAFKGKAALIGIAALGVISLFTNPAKFFEGVITLLKDTLKSLFNPLFEWLNKQGIGVDGKNKKGKDDSVYTKNIINNNEDALHDRELAESAYKDFFDTVEANENAKHLGPIKQLTSNYLNGFGAFRSKPEKKEEKYNMDMNEKIKAEIVYKMHQAGTKVLTDEELAIVKEKMALDPEKPGLVEKSIDHFNPVNWFDILAPGSSTTSFLYNNIIDPTTNATDDVNKELEDYKPLWKQADDVITKSVRPGFAVGESNVKENDIYNLHKGEGVLTASANHLFGGAETTAGILNAFARNNTLTNDKNTLSSILGTVKGTLSPDVSESLTTAMYGDTNDTKELEDYLAKVRKESLTVDDSKYWKFNTKVTDKFGGIAQSLFKAIRFANYPARLINSTLGDVANDMDDIAVEMTGSSTGTAETTTTANKSLGSKIKNGISSAFGKIKSFFTGGTGGGENDAIDTGDRGSITLGQSPSDYYKFPSLDIQNSDLNQNRDGRAHKGLDLIVRNRGDLSIKSLTNGTVVNSTYSDSYGHTVQVEDENGMYHLYAHMSSRNVKVGDIVKVGDVLGIEGTTGWSTGNHLHYEVGTGRAGNALTGHVHPAEYMEGYSKGLSSIKATPIEKYTLGSYWKGTSGQNAISIANAAQSPNQSTATTASKGTILDILYGPIKGFNSKLKSIFTSQNPEEVQANGYNVNTSPSIISGNTDGEKIWNYLRSVGMSKNGAAGIMGNLYAESNLQSNNIQNSFESRLGSDTEYTNKVDNGSYTNFANDDAGYGLAQWTYSTRKQNLLNAAKKAGTSISDIKMQLDFLMSEFGEGYPGLLSLAQSNTASIQDVSDEMLTKFERPDNMYAKRSERAGYGKNMLDTYGGLGGGDDTNIGSFNRFDTSGMTPSMVNAQNSTAVVVLMNRMIQYLAQITKNTKSTSDSLQSIENKTSTNQSTTKATTKPTGSSTGSGMFDIANQRKKELANKKYSVAKAIAKGM